MKRFIVNAPGFNFRKPLYNADVFWNKLINVDKWYCVYPCICYQVDGFSDNEHRVVESSRIIGVYDSQVRKDVYNK